MIRKKEKLSFKELIVRLGAEKVGDVFDLPDIKLPEEMTVRFIFEVYVGQKDKATAGNFFIRLTAKDGSLKDVVGVCGGPYALKTDKELGRLVFDTVIGAFHKANKIRKKKMDEPPPPDTGTMPDESGNKKVN